MTKSRKIASMFPVGSIVLILPDCYRYCNRASKLGWVDEMYSKIGMVGKVVINNITGIQVMFDDGSDYWYTPGGLELAEDQLVDVPSKYHVGQIFKHRSSGELYILCVVEYNSHAQIVLICLNDGQRWNNPVEVDYLGNISDKELSMIQDHSGAFDLQYESFDNMQAGVEVDRSRHVVYEETSVSKYTSAAEFESDSGKRFIRFAD